MVGINLHLHIYASLTVYDKFQPQKQQKQKIVKTKKYCKSGKFRCVKIFANFALRGTRAKIKTREYLCHHYHNTVANLSAKFKTSEIPFMTLSAKN